jgi:hypothetical protein
LNSIKEGRMLKNKSLLVALTTLSLCVAVHPANAQATRTWVSGVGDDANPCSRTAPCKTFAGAISKTQAGGEISALDPGGFGAVTITKAITIDGGGGQVASVLAAGTNGIVVAAGANQTVTLRNLRINGVAATPTGGLNGVQFQSGTALHIENCTIFGFTQNGININLNTSAATRVFVTDTVVANSAGGIAAHNAGAGNMLVAMQRTTLSQNSAFGFKADGGGGTGFVLATVADSLVAGNGTGILAVGGASAGVGVQVTRSSIVNNVTNGAQSNGSAGFAQILFSNSVISGNGTGLSPVSGGVLGSYKNNSTEANFNLGGFTTTINPE